MPGTKRYKKSKPNRFHTYGRSIVRTGPLQRVERKVNFLQGLINVEFKNHDVEQTSTDMDVNGTIIDLNYVNQGDGTESRDGSQFRMKSLEVRYLLSLNDNLTSPVSCRVIFFLDTDPNGSGPTVASLLDDTTNPHLSPRNLDSRFRYVILYDKMVTLNPNGLERYTTKIYKKLNLKAMFTGATASDANVKKNGLHALFLSSQASGATYKPTFLMNSRIRFIDN